MHRKDLGTIHKCAHSGWRTTTIIGMVPTIGTITTIQDFLIICTQEVQVS
jgi:hypothetical protein